MDRPIPPWLLAELELRAKRCLEAAEPGAHARELAGVALEVVAGARAGASPYRPAPAEDAHVEESLALVSALEREIERLRARVAELEAARRPG